MPVTKDGKEASRKDRFCWLGYVIRMDHQCITRQALHWKVPEFKRGPGRPCTNWRSTVNKDLLRMGITWEETEVAAHDGSELVSVWPNASTGMQVKSTSRSSLDNATKSDM